MALNFESSGPGSGPGRWHPGGVEILEVSSTQKKPKLSTSLKGSLPGMHSDEEEKTFKEQITPVSPIFLFQITSAQKNLDLHNPRASAGVK